MLILYRILELETTTFKFIWKNKCLENTKKVIGKKSGELAIPETITCYKTNKNINMVFKKNQQVNQYKILRIPK